MKFKKLLCGVVGVTVLAASFSVSAAEFSDVKGHWAESYVNAMVKKGYIKGYAAGRIAFYHGVWAAAQSFPMRSLI